MGLILGVKPPKSAQITHRKGVVKGLARGYGYPAPPAPPAPPDPTVFSDSFVDVGAPIALSSHTPDTLGTSWSYEAGTFTISTSGQTQTTGGLEIRAIAGEGAANGRMAMRFSSNTTTSLASQRTLGGVIRQNPDTSKIVIGISPSATAGTLRVWEVSSGGIFTQIASETTTSNWNPAATYELSVTFSGTSITVVLVEEGNGTVATATPTSSFNQTETKAGIQGSPSGGVPFIVYDFEVTTDTVFSDSFVDAGAPIALQSHTPDTAGTGWTEINDGFSIETSGSAKTTGGNEARMLAVGTGTADGILSMRWARPQAVSVTPIRATGATIRYATDTSHIKIGIIPSGITAVIRIYEVSNTDVFTQIASENFSEGWDTGATYELVVTFSGTSISATIEKIGTGQVANIATTSSHNQTETKYGMNGFVNSGNDDEVFSYEVST